MSEPKWWRGSVLDALEERDRALAELRDIQQKAYAYQELYERVVGEREDAQAALDRVEALHRPVVTLGGWKYCFECSVKIPCPTIEALRGDAS